MEIVKDVAGCSCVDDAGWLRIGGGVWMAGGRGQAVGNTPPPVVAETVI
jgi:hypothetical protein